MHTDNTICIYYTYKHKLYIYKNTTKVHIHTHVHIYIYLYINVIGFVYYIPCHIHNLSVSLPSFLISGNDPTTYSVNPESKESSLIFFRLTSQSKFCQFYHQNISLIQPFFSVSTFSTQTQTKLFSCLDCCSSLLIGFLASTVDLFQAILHTTKSACIIS